MKFLPVSSNLVSPEHAFTITKGQEYKAPPNFFGKIKSSQFLLCTLSPPFWKNG